MVIRHGCAWAAVVAWALLHGATVTHVAAAAQDAKKDGVSQAVPTVQPALPAEAEQRVHSHEGAALMQAVPGENEPAGLERALVDASGSPEAGVSEAKSTAAAGEETPAVGAETPAGSAQGAQPTAAPETAEPGGTPAPIAADESVLLNFERGDIREVIHSLATALGLSYMIDPRVEGEVTIRTLGRIPKDHLFPVFNRILRSNGIAAIPVDGVYHIVPVEDAKTRAIMPPTAASREQLEQTDSFVIEIIPLHHVASEDMVPVIEPFLAPGGDVYSYPRGNLLIVTDLMSNIDRLRYLVQTLDTDAFQGMHTAVFKIKHGDLDIIAEELTTLLASYGHAVDGSTGLSLIPMPRLESLTAISYDDGVLDQVREWVDMLDISPDKGTGRKVRVYHVENAKAADLAAILNELFGGGGSSGIGGSARRGAVAQRRTAFGRPAPTQRGAGRQPRRPTRRPGNTRSARQISAGGLNSIMAEQRSRTATGTSGRGGRIGANQTAGRGGGTGRRGRGRGRGAQTGGGGGAVGFVFPGGSAGVSGLSALAAVPPIFKEEVRIVADDVTNSLVVLAVNQDYEKIVSVLKEIDVVPRQVVIEVMIAEVSLTGALEFGIDNAIRFGLGGSNEGVSAVRDLQSIGSSTAVSGGTTSDTGGGTTGGTEGNGNTDTPTSGAGFGGLLDALFAIANPAGGGVASVITDRKNFGIALRALASRGLVKIVSSPHIIAADNREAHIQVGESIPVLTGTSSSTASNLGTIVNQIQYRDVGTILTILPQVNSAGLVNMQITQEVSGVGQEIFGNTNSPSFSTREAETTVVVQDGDSVLIGGIIDHQRRVSRSGVPFLMELPVFGRFFRSERASMQRTELLVLITPHVILNREKALAVTEDFKRVIHGFAEMHREHHPNAARDGSAAPPGREAPF